MKTYVAQINEMISYVTQITNEKSVTTVNYEEMLAQVEKMITETRANRFKIYSFEMQRLIFKVFKDMQLLRQKMTEITAKSGISSSDKILIQCHESKLMVQKRSKMVMIKLNRPE